MSIDVTITNDGAEIYARPNFGRPVSFNVTQRVVKISASPWDRRRESRFVVGLTGNPEVEFSRHLTAEAAQRACLRRARKYDAAYSVPRGLAVCA